MSEAPPRWSRPSAPSADPLLGKTLDDRYIVEEKLGEGGMGIVYRARHKAISKSVAIKVLRPEASRHKDAIARFRQEAESTTAIGNEHIVDILDFGSLSNGSAYFAMEHLRGRTLSQLLREDGALSPSRAVRIAIQITRALSAAHDHGIIHRDLKPDNIFMVTRSDGEDFVKVLDFGLAKVASVSASAQITREGQVFGTPHYMSPEQCAGQPVDARTDVYALGAVLYQLLSGRCPFEADSLLAIMTMHRLDPAPRFSELDPPLLIDPELEVVVQRCLEKSPQNRYETMATLRDDLLRILPMLPATSGTFVTGAPQSSSDTSVHRFRVAYAKCGAAHTTVDAADR